MYTRPALQFRAGQESITASLWLLTAHIYHVMIIVTGGFDKKSFFIIWRSSRTQLFFKTGVIRNFAIFTGKHLFQPRPKRDPTCDSCENCKIFKNSFFYGTLPVAKKACRSGQSMLFTH